MRSVTHEIDHAASKSASVVQLNLCEARARFFELVETVRRGKTVVIAKRGHPLAKLVAVDAPSCPLRLGLMKGKIHIAKDFDAPLSKTVHRSFEGDEVT